MNNLGAALQQLGAMIQAGQSGPDAGGPVNWAMVTDIARKALVQAGDPSVGDADRRAVTEAVHLADVWLDPAVTFPSTTASPAAWSRSEWLEATTPVWRQVVQPIAEHMQQVVGQSMPGQELDLTTLSENLPEQFRDMFPGGLPPEMAQMMAPMLGMLQQLGAAAFSMQLGQALAALASDVVSASDIGIPLTSDAQPALLPRNVDAFSEGLGIAVDDVRLYLALRESAHQRLFAHVSVASSAHDRRRRGVRPRRARRPVPPAGGDGRHRHEQPRGPAAADGQRTAPAGGHRGAACGGRAARDAARARRGLGRRRRRPGDRGSPAVGDCSCARRCVGVVPPAAPRRRPSPPSSAWSCARAWRARRRRCSRSCARAADSRRATRCGRTPTCCPGPDDLADPLGFIEGNVTELEFEVPDDLQRAGRRTRGRRPGRRPAHRRVTDPAFDRLHVDAAGVLGGWEHPEPQQRVLRDAYLGFLREHPDAMSRECRVGHLTASALVMDERRTRVLLTLHPKVGPLAAARRPRRARRRVAARGRPPRDDRGGRHRRRHDLGRRRCGWTGIPCPAAER